MSDSPSHPEKIQVAVGAVILDEGHRVLLVKHVEAKRGGFWFGKWICPGGMLQHGESIEDGTLREVKEETGLDIELKGRPIAFDRIVTQGKNLGLHVIYIDHVARRTGGKLKAGSDAGIARWFSREELRDQWRELHEDTQRLLLESKIVDEDVTVVV